MASSYQSYPSWPSYHARSVEPADFTQVKKPPVTIAILNCNGRMLLQRTLESARAMEYPDKQLLLVDDGSTDDSVDFVRRHFPDVAVIEMGTNTKMLNQVRNTALENAQTDLVLISDNDICFQSDCLQQLVRVAGIRNDVAVVIPRVMFQHDPDRIYIDYNDFHYVGCSTDPNRNRTLSELSIEALGGLHRSFGCGIHLIVQSRLGEVGYYDADYPMGWGDDGEFHHRLNLSGRLCCSVAEAVVYHEAIKGTPRIYGQVHNRFALILQTYERRSLLVLAPALLVYDLALFCLLVLKGKQGEYLLALRDVWRQRKRLLQKRRLVQATRRVRDRDLLTCGDLYVPGIYRSGRVAQVGLGLLNRFFRLYWRLARLLL